MDSPIWAWLHRASAVAIIAVAIVIIWERYGAGSGEDEPPGSLPPDRLVSLVGSDIGSSNAPVAVLMFTDFECPYCAKFAAESWPLLKQNYVDRGLVRFVFRHLPLPNHSHALGAGVAAECAARQGKFWEMHDKIFLRQREPLNDALFGRFALELALDLTRWTECREDPAVSQTVLAGRQQAEELGLRSTPSFLIGRVQGDGQLLVGVVVRGARPADEFSAALDSALADR